MNRVERLREEFSLRRARAEVVAWAQVAEEGDRALMVFAAGHYQGDLGDARLNQRAALYAEAILDKPVSKRPARQRKTFDSRGGTLELEFEFPTE